MDAIFEKLVAEWRKRISFATESTREWAGVYQICADELAAAIEEAERNRLKLPEGAEKNLRNLIRDLKPCHGYDSDQGFINEATRIIDPDEAESLIRTCFAPVLSRVAQLEAELARQEKKS